MLATDLLQCVRTGCNKHDRAQSITDCKHSIDCKHWSTIILYLKLFICCLILASASHPQGCFGFSSDIQNNKQTKTIAVGGWPYLRTSASHKLQPAPKAEKDKKYPKMNIYGHLKHIHTINKQFLDEAEHDIKNYPDRGR